MPRNGYAWWYIDALSDDGANGLTLIAFIGSVFSPYYAWARRRGRGDPLDHVALNVALYGRGGKRWCLTERSGGALRRDARTLAIGPSHATWDGAGLTVHIDEVTVPWPSRVRGRIRLEPSALVGESFQLDPAGRHRWRPIAPNARVEVSLAQPSLSWSGAGYLDTNAGSEPLENAFVRWDWSRSGGPRGARILYDVTHRPTGGADAERGLSLALQIAADGTARRWEAPARVGLPATRWRIARGTRCDVGHVPRVVETLEDTPFYARSILATQLDGEPVTAMHESLDLDRFRAGIVQLMLPFRMPRARR